MKDGGPAFPGFGQVHTTDAQGRTGPQSMWGLDGSTGMSLRDFFAAMAMKSGTFAHARLKGASRTEAAAECWADAEAMLSTRGPDDDNKIADNE